MNKILASLTLASLTVCGTAAMAQSATEYRSADGLLTVRSAGTGYTPSGPAPEFAQLDSNGDGLVDNTEAAGYKLLANDFRLADSNRDGRISKREYQHWAAMP